MHKTHLFVLLFALLIGTACNKEKHFISDNAFRAEVEKDFQAKQAALPDGDLFAVFNQQMTPEEKEALTFLYAYMPIGDITDYDGKLYLDNIRSSFQAKQEMPWGDSIPEDIFRHFVLPIRVNNENLDESRMVFFDELKDRVKGMSLYDAVLEVNHWCHEKVIYTPSDARTSSPLASVKTAYGRCGEESTFTVAALRSVGIPARQVYTPRWAHTDDNHAWVEAWVNGKWYFLGACEPEPVLNLGWFNGPAYRGMLMHTKVFGKYNGPEEVMLETDGYTEINVIDNYAPTGKAIVTVVDTDGNPVPDANVEFKIYNYAEFYTVANKKTDAEGKTFLTAGKGDMFVWATKDGKFGFDKVSFGKGDATIKLDKKPGGQRWDLKPLYLPDLKCVFSKWQTELEGHGWNSLFWGNHDYPRAISRFGNDTPEYREQSGKMLVTLLYGMKGTPYYQGDEIGMTNEVNTKISQYQDIESANFAKEKQELGWSEEKIMSYLLRNSRDNARTPMQWNHQEHAGFTTGTPWISVNENYKKINAAAQVNDPDSIFSYYKKLIELRHQMEIIVYGVYKSKAIEHPDVFAYTTTLGDEKLFVVCNFREQEMDFTLEDGFTGDEKVLISNYDDVVKTENGIYLRPYEAKVFYRK